MTERLDNVKNDIKTLIENSKSAFDAAAMATGDKALEFRAMGEDFLNSATDKVSELPRVAAAVGKRAIGDADDYIKKNPWQSVGAAAAAGLILGLLISRK